MLGMETRNPSDGEDFITMLGSRMRDEANWSPVTMVKGPACSVRIGRPSVWEIASATISSGLLPHAATCAGVRNVVEVDCSTQTATTRSSAIG